jgi:hypothetical protein
MTTTTPVTAWIRIGLVALPLYGLIAGYTTRKPQPDQVTDPEGWRASSAARRTWSSTSRATSSEHCW